MGRKKLFIFLGLIIFLIIGTVNFSNATVVSFIDPFNGVDNSSGWSINDSTVSLGVTGFNILEGFGEVKSVNGISITQRGTRGLGVDGNIDTSNNPGDEFDEIDYPEKLQVKFDTPVYISKIVLRSLFIENGQAERGIVNFYNGATLLSSNSFSGTQSEGLGELILNPNLTITMMAFNAPGDSTLGPISEYAVAGFDVQVPEPGTLLLFGTSLAAFGLAIRRRKK